MASTLHSLLARAARPHPPETDGELLARYTRARDEAAFGELVRRNGPLVLRACRHVIGSAAADDAFQATFLSFRDGAGVVHAYLWQDGKLTGMGALGRGNSRVNTSTPAATPSASPTARPSSGGTAGSTTSTR
jgi:hypothetical protein